MIILEKGERADSLWGMETEYITDEQIEALSQPNGDDCDGEGREP